MGMFRDWVEKKVSEVNKLSPEEEAELGDDVRKRSVRSLGFGKNEPPPQWKPSTEMPLQRMLGKPRPKPFSGEEVLKMLNNT